VSERGELEVFLPLERIPTRAENQRLLHLAFAEARRLCRQVGGRVLGLSTVARAETPDGQMALRARFAVEAPEGTFHRRKSF
jgi:hypothetical protein